MQLVAFAVHVITIVAEAAPLTVSIVVPEEACTTSYNRSDCDVMSSDAAPHVTVVPVEVVSEKLIAVPTDGTVVSELPGSESILQPFEKRKHRQTTGNNSEKNNRLFGIIISLLPVNLLEFPLTVLYLQICSTCCPS